ncbi:MAG: hypothetical protein IJZ42_11825 [Lachnospiraceae bacterium]|nr:hypothetical protein [Lachnospiraceae bacterium]
MIKVIIYGTGAIANFLIEYIRYEKVKVVAYADSYSSDTQVRGVKVIKEKDIIKEEFDYIIIAFGNVRKGIENLSIIGIDPKKIIAYSPLADVRYYEKMFTICNEDARTYLNDDLLNDIFDLEPIKYHLCAMHTYKNYYEIIERDYVREQTLALISEEIKRKKIEGEVAELGVYKGEFSKKINSLFCDKIIYLFDTFEGFDGGDVKQDITLLTSNTELLKFKDTTAEAVLSSLPYPEKCIIKKGYFPDTFDLKDVKFSFVSIDVDLYQPILLGLKIFYPLLTKGGYIMIHDYNSEGYKGVKKAVIDYCDMNEVSYIPLPDNCGSIVITK